jgi:sirohydrochlorin ferrochelatase
VNWQAATGQDANSISVDPLFVNPTGTAATADLHIQPNSPVINVGTSIAAVTNDFDNDARGFAPDIGADEIPVCGNNVAAASNGSTATASSQLSAQYPASGVINGEHNGNDWGFGGGWADNTQGVFPDNVEVDFNVSQSINEIDVYTLKDDINSGSTVNDTTTFNVYGATAYDVQYWTGSVWQTVTGGSISGNNFVKRRFAFASVTTDRIRVVVNAAADGAASRIVEVEAFTCTPSAPSPTPTPTPSPSPTPNPCAIPADNVARAANGSTASASSQYSPSFPASGAINGEHNGNDWAAGGGWADNSPGVFPDNVDVNFNVSQTINEIDVYTLKDDFNSGSTVTDTTTFTNYGITSFQVQYWNGATFVDVPGGNVTGNNLVKRKFIFPNIATDKIRVVVNGSADGYSRVVEIEAFSCTPVVAPTPTPTPTPNPCAIPADNVARAANGSTASASSQYSAAFPAAGAINGEHDGNDWGSGGGWADNSLSVFPDNIDVNFNVVQTINEIDVYTLKDEFNNGSTVTDATTFANYGITSFQVQYWNGAAFVDVPGGNVTGNNLVKRKFIFPNIATDKIRVVVNGSADGFSRIVEIEAFSCTPLTPPAPSKGAANGNETPRPAVAPALSTRRARQ